MKDRFALHFVPEDYSVGGQRLMGRHAAGAALMRAVAGSGLSAVGCFAAGEAHAGECERALREQGFKGEVEWLSQGRPQQIERFGVLYHPAPGIARLAWRRLGIGERRYSLCGVTHTTASHAVMSAVAGMLVAPLRSWDAVICTSRVVRDSVREVLERQAEYLRARLGAQRFELPQLPLIPLGVHCRDFVFDEAARIGARRQLGIEEGDVAFLFLGRLSFHAKAHPQQMFSALERAGKDGRQVHLVLCGWFANEAIEKAFREAAALLCPSVRLTVLDGRVPGNQACAWAAADVFTSLADNVQESFGLTPLEAMAAGLPCVVSDWNGYRDTVRDGVDGYRIPTVMPGAGAGLDLAQRYDDGVDNYDHYCGHTSQAVALDGAQLAQAYERLIKDGELRRQMGENGRRRAREEFDWQLVFGRYRALWSELDERRRADAVLAPALPQTVPDRLDPFAVFASYPSAQLTPETMVELAPDASLAQLREYRELGINRFAAASLPTLEEFGQIFGSIGSRPMQVDELLDTLGPCDRPTLLRGLAWLCKMDLLRISTRI
ncbi:glycosyltransferase family 4 protein [Massilia norwichensis]|uniref:Glycosyltransferase family 4 protein n=1 Tax=Massilia norwichensis TaxID=1442366 RepID=A0ABT2A306_9BURK|nr:glycosyltransferase family 4 protein [Massilia norwichensis]MCS0588559.1 glycosyltransferase family 4 protein [Massilia norwichensis]